MFPFNTTLCSNTAERSFGTGALSSSFLSTVQVLRLEGSKDGSADLLIPPTPSEDFSLQHIKS